MRDFLLLMTDSNNKLLTDLEVRTKQIMLVCDSLRDENRSLRDKLAQNEQDCLELKQQLSDITQKYDHLKMARTITAASVDVESARAKLSKMVREVDKCINLLK